MSTESRQPHSPSSANTGPSGRLSFLPQLQRINRQVVRTTLLAVIIGSLLAVLLLTLGYWRGGSLNDAGNQRILNGIIVAMVAGTCLLILQLGHARLASSIFGLFLLSFFIGTTIWLQNGVFSVGLNIIVIVILLAGFLYTPKMAIYVALACSLAAGSVLLAQTSGALQIVERNKPPPGVIALVMVIIYLLVGWITCRYARLFRDALANLEQTTRELEHSISNLQQREQELIRAKQAADQANAAKSRFLATMSHEIRTPMNGVLGMAQLLLEPGLSDNLRMDYARTLHQSGSTLMAILNDILDWSKIEAGKMELEHIPFQPAELMREMHRLFLLAAQGKGLEFQLCLSDGLPGAVLGDPTRLRQILMNLLGNAIKFTHSGSITLQLDAESAGASTCRLRFTVSDTGIGIAAGQQQKLFRPFTQADGSTTRQFGGTGLGLAIVQRFVELMGGKLGLDSQPGHGSRFWFELTLPHADMPRPVQEGEHQAGRPLHGRILLAEDNPVNQLVAKTMLNRAGLEVVCVDDGQAAVDAVCSGAEFNLVLMDCQMPRLGGIEATQKIRAWETLTGRSPLAIVAVTAGAFDDDRSQCLAAGMNDFLSKPIASEPLQQLLRQWLTER